MKVFISWSGDLSRDLANLLRDWLPSVLQAVKPYFTPDDIDKGARWSSQIAKELQESCIGLFCLTRDNPASPWMMFEAGAISRVVGDAYVCPVLFGVKPSDIVGPLNQFQLTEFNKSEMQRLVATINEQCGDQKLLAQTRDHVFEKWWPDLESGVRAILERHSTETQGEVRTEREMLEEMLPLLRQVAKEARESEKERERKEMLDALARRVAADRARLSLVPPETALPDWGGLAALFSIWAKAGGRTADGETDQEGPGSDT